ncbi:hypothetical protein GCM10027568_23930 [Humibacter soli]
MQRHPWRRLVAWLIDWVCILVWAGVVAAVGVPLYLAGVTRNVDDVTLNVIAAATIVVPVTLTLAALESSGWQATLGKRMLRLRVQARDVARPSFWVALLRNALKVALPWTIGHAAVIAIYSASTSDAIPPWVWVITIAAYALPIVYIVALFVRRGRTPYDAASGTRVSRTAG